MGWRWTDNRIVMMALKTSLVSDLDLLAGTPTGWKDDREQIEKRIAALEKAIKKRQVHKSQGFAP